MKKEKLQHITKQNVLQAIERIKEEGVPSARESNTYDLVYEGVVYPPKYITSLAGYFSEKGQFIFASIFDGGEESFCFAKLRELGFEILPKADTKELPKPNEADRKMHYKYTYRVIDEKLDQVLFKEHFTEYIRYCRESSWLTLAEGYKFRFGRWMAENIDLETQTDEEVLAKCNESQEQTYDPQGKAKGINFIVAQKRYQDEFISLIDIQNIRRLKNGELLNDYDLKESPMSFPKFSTWAGILLPEEQMLFGSEELTLGIAHLFHLDDYPKSGVRAFNLANTCLKEIKASILNDFLEESKELINTIFPGTTIQPVDMVWLVQDFILFLNRRVLKFKPEYYWVNQGDNYKAELEHGIVAAPNHKLHHHDRLRHLNEGDKIIHYANKAIRAISTVTKEFVLKPRPYLVDGDADLIVEVDYQVLENPILSEQVKAKFKDKEKLLPKKYGPLTKDLGVVQMYMCAFNEVSYNELFNVPNYWVFQGNPKMFDFETALQDEIVTDWTVSAHEDKIKVGDKIILWIAGTKSGCYALAEVTSEPHEKTSSLDDHLWKEEDKSELKADIKITNNLVKNPILKSVIESLEELSELKVGHRGTNFSATEHEYQTILDLISSRSSSTPELVKNIGIMKNNLNKIIYGPPGTGKTYNTINIAVEIIDPEFYRINKSDRKKIKEKFEEYIGLGKIDFTTFHQSMSYEDFIEGIKPFSESGKVTYGVEDGIFKEACIKAKGISNLNTNLENIDFSKKSFFKMSLGGKNKKNIHNWCIENNLIALGWGRDNDYSELKGIKQFEEFRDLFKSKFPNVVQESKFNVQAINTFLNWMKKGDIVLVSLGNKTIDAVGIIEGDYVFNKDSKHSYHHTRKVRWLGTKLDASPKLFVEKSIAQQSIYHFDQEDIIVDRFDKEFNNIKKEKKSFEDNHVMIIDEINRGNVSSIFGELITLLEEDKRKGNKEELEVILPYSKEPFSIPNNLHIIGTMNTADRSVEALDTALRRRFSFVEMMPDVSLLESKEIDGINLKDVLSTINDRIEILIDRDHTIGHSYFMNINNSKELKLAFKDKIVPLLQEYFYGDYGKIGLVLGEGFVKSHSKSKNPFAGFKYEGKEELNRDFYDLVAIDDTFDIINALENLLNNPKDNQD